ncbi:hypothetical protein [Cupriavidus agavae]|uniref:hypothetical protein n=1 Tax=Cupriavidus agavae TaxID=1001822 RepID=UPI00102AB630|nr:hypothetical protein [Cupriavidus agavae]
MPTLPATCAGPGGQFANAFPQNDDAESELSVHAANRVQEALDNWLGSSTERIRWLVEETIDAALDAAVEKVQQILKVDAGDVAAVSFSWADRERRFATISGAM